MLVGLCGKIEECLDIADIGFDYVELSGRNIMSLSDEDFNKYADQLNSSALPCYAINDYCGVDNAIVGSHVNEDSNIMYAQKLCKRASILGAKYIGIGAPSARILEDGFDIQVADCQMISFLKMLCKEASKYNITVCLEQVNYILCNYLNKNRDVYTMVKNLGISNLGMVYDYWNAYVEGEDINNIEQFMPFIRHLHISSDLEDHARGYMSKDDVDTMQKLFAQAVNLGYTGNISVEAPNVGVKNNGAECLANVRRALLCR